MFGNAVRQIAYVFVQLEGVLLLADAEPQVVVHDRKTPIEHTYMHLFQSDCGATLSDLLHR